MCVEPLNPAPAQLDIPIFQFGRAQRSGPLRLNVSLLKDHVFLLNLSTLFSCLNVAIGFFRPVDNIMPTTKPGSRAETVLSRRRIEGLIAEGRSIVIVNQNVLKVDAFLKYHPGGEKAMSHVVGKDATDEVNG